LKKKPAKTKQQGKGFKKYKYTKINISKMYEKYLIEA
jgi:hypothetical protein